LFLRRRRISVTDSVEAAFEGFEGELPESVDEAAVDRMRRVAYVLDEAVPVPFTDRRVGLDPLLGVVPVVGDVLGAAVSTYIVVEAAYLGVSYTTLLRMLANVAVDTGLGLVPYAGPVLDALWDANVRNLELVLEDLAADVSGADPAAVEVEVTPE
jgi:hypothetical protein